MKHLLLTTIAAVVLVGCGESQQSAPAPEAKPVEPVAEAAPPEPPTAKAPDISIHDAADSGNIEAVKQHLAAGTDVNAKDAWRSGYIDGWTPLHAAAGNGHKEVAELLIANGADVNAKAWDGKTPLDWAEKVYDWHSPEDNAAKKETANLLRKHGGKTGEELLMPRLVQHGRFAFSFDAKEGKVYEVQDSFNLLNWEVIKTYTGTGVSVRFDEERDHDPPQWFYRVRVVE
jgi:hypothetical protein